MIKPGKHLKRVASSAAAGKTAWPGRLEFQWLPNNNSGSGEGTHADTANGEQLLGAGC